MKEILDKSFDSEFDKIENLTWYPWVGKDYTFNKRRVLVIGESHYVNENADENNGKREQELLSDNTHTRDCLYEVLIDKSWNNRTYSRLMEALYDRGIIPDNKTALSKIAYYNFIQTPMDYTVRERPNSSHYITAWECFLKVITILYPTDCIFIGVESISLFEEFMKKCGVPYTEINTLEKRNNTYPQRTSIKLNHDINIVFIKHSSAFFSPEQWHEFLKQQLPEAMKWLNTK